MDFQLGVTPTERLAQLAAREPHQLPIDLATFGFAGHMLVEQLEEAAGLRR